MNVWTRLVCALAIFVLVAALITSATYSLNYLKMFAAVCLALVALAALVFVFAGPVVIRIFPPVTTFQRVHDEWATLNVNWFGFQAHTTLGDAVQMRFEEVWDPANPSELLERTKHLRFGNVITVVSRPSLPLRSLVMELRYYCAFFVALLVVGFLQHVGELHGATLTTLGPRLTDLFLEGGVIPILEGAMIIYLFIRIVTETSWMRSLVEGE